jgi:hypothetical protein
MSNAMREVNREGLLRVRTAVAAFGLCVSIGGVSAQGIASDVPRPPAQQGGPGTLKDAVELCDRLAGTERQLCLERARENREQARELPQPPLGVTPGQGAHGSAAPAPAEPPRDTERSR